MQRVFRTQPIKSIFKSNTFQLRFYADEANFHDDFKTKVKTPASKEEDEMKAYFSQFDKEIKENPILLFMKGTAVQPQCGFSMRVVQLLNAYGYRFKAVNVLEDAGLREAIKVYSNWPTIPQLYVKGEFVGGCDITMNLHKEGQLKSILEDSGAEKLN